jgi:hypothetical protein
MPDIVIMHQQAELCFNQLNFASRREFEEVDVRG